MSTPAKPNCPRCGTQLSCDALEGLCPTCVGQVAFGAAPAEEIQPEPTHLQPEEAGEWIGAYRLIEPIGEGGFGTVWVADQERPVRRRVALKIIKLGMDTKEVIARFEQERQALAILDHPHIAKVLDAGATRWGRPFFVMELVHGSKITDYCDQANLSAPERLALFIQVCHAVQHAHQKGIIHRDLKPSNILVALHDGVPVPKVIDFGVAKATQQQRLTDLTIYTQFEQIIGTPLYMSPEQAEMSGLDIDTRSDIYSLGVLLYELLTGRTPFDPTDLMRQGLDEIRRAIREREPLTPSTFIRTMSDATRATVARQRQSDPAKLLRQVRGDLDWIVMKALEKDRTRRYETANGLAMDIQRHLANEPVHARPPSAIYRFRRLVRRNRGVFAAVGAVTAALVIGLGMATRSYLNERRARAGETRHREFAEAEKRQAQASAREAMASELKARRFLYAADMNLVQQALRTNVGRARLLLDRHRPALGELDLRGWEWRYLWQECRSGAQVMLTQREGQPVFSTSFSPDGALLLAGYYDGLVELWDVPARKLLKVVQSPVNQRAHVAFSPAGGVFATTREQGVVTAVNLKTGTEAPLFATQGEVRDISYSRDGEWLAVLSRMPERLKILRASDGSTVMSYSPPSGGGVFFNNARISPDKQRLYISSGAFGNPSVRCLSIPSGDLIWEIPIGIIEDGETIGRSDTGFTAMDLSPDGRTLVVATGYTDRQIRVLDAGTGQLLKKLSGHTGYILQVAFSKDGQFLVSSSEDQTARLWETATWTKLKAPLRGHNHEVNAIAISDDGHTLASGNKDGELLLWDVQATHPANGRRTLPSRIESALALPLDRMVLGRTVDAKWLLIDLLTLAEEPVPTADIAGSGQYPVLFPMSRRPQPMELNKVQLGLKGLLNEAVVSPDGKMLAVASDSGQIGLYDPATLAKIDIVRSNQGAVFGVAFSPDNQRLALACGGVHGIALWDVATRQELLTLASPNALLFSVEFTDDGNILLAGSRQMGSNNAGSCQYWPAPSWAEIEDAERTGGLWPQTGSTSRVPPPTPTYEEAKILLEQVYREKLAAERARSAEYSVSRDENLGDLANLLRLQGRNGEAEPLLREQLEFRRQRTPRDGNAVLTAVTDLLAVTLSLVHAEHTTAGNYEPQADALVGELLELVEQRSAANPNDSFLALRAAVFQAGFSKDAHHLAACLRVIEHAEKSPNDPFAGERAARAWCFRPTADSALLARALHLARQAAAREITKAQRGWYQLTLGMAEYRAGNDEAAEQAILRAEEFIDKSPNLAPQYQPYILGLSRLYRAMILIRRGEQAKAGELISQAEALMPPLPDNLREAFLNGDPLYKLMFWLSYKEAKALLKPPAGSAEK